MTMTTMTTFSRNWVAEDFKPADWQAIKPLVDELLGREISTPDELAAWACDYSELQSVIAEERTNRSIAKDQNTESKEAKGAYFFWLDEIGPRLKPAYFELDKKLATHPLADQLEAGEFGCYLKRLRSQLDIFREENVPLITEDDKLSTAYSGIVGGQTVQFDGAERTAPQMKLYFLEPDRSLRERAFRTLAERREKDFEQLETIFDQQFEVRRQIAANAGLSDYRAYCWRAYNRFDYTPDHCLTFMAAAEEVCMPRIRALAGERRNKLAVDRLRPWDLDVCPEGHPPLKPFETTEELATKARDTFALVDQSLAAHFEVLLDNGLLDLDSRKAKAPGGYQATYQERRLPFIFMNAAGSQDNVETMLHEGGHAFHALEHRNQRLITNRFAPMEFCEVASMSMELICSEFIDQTYYNAEDARRARIVQLEGVLSTLVWVAVIDGFQHWLYTHPGHDHEQRAETWLSLLDRFQPPVDWTGLEAARRYRWMQQMHLFGYPFYYIEYGIAELGALQIWRNYRTDPEQTIRKYQYAQSLGNTRSLPELFEAAGIRFDFSADIMEELVGLVENELTKLKG